MLEIPSPSSMSGADLSMLWVVIIVVIGHEPLVNPEYTSGLEDLEDFGIDVFQRWVVSSGFDGVDGVEGFRRKWHLLQDR
jgi:hypothetical protein